MQSDQAFRELAPQECKVILEKEGPCIVIDVRTPDEYSHGHIRDAENLDYFRSDFRDQILKKDRKQKYLVYCKKGVRGARTMELMRECGFCDVINISGGFEHWQSQGMPVEK